MTPAQKQALEAARSMLEDAQARLRAQIGDRLRAMKRLAEQQAAAKRELAVLQQLLRSVSNLEQPRKARKAKRLEEIAP